MAEKKMTKAQKQAEPKKNSGRVRAEEVTSGATKFPRPPVQGDAAFPLRYMVAAVCAVVFLMFLAVVINPDGIVLVWIASLFKGLFGTHAFYLCIPVLLYIIWIQLASRGRRVRHRTFAVVGFVLLFGCFSHLVSAPVLSGSGLQLFPELFNAGIAGYGGGLVCGLLTELMTRAFGRFFSYSLVLVCGALCLLAALRLSIFTLAGQVRAFVLDLWARRETHEETEEDQWGPATRFFDTIAQKKLEREERRRLTDGQSETREKSLKERTRQMLQQLVPDYDAEPELLPITTEDPGPAVLTEAELQARRDAEAKAEEALAKKKVTAKEAAISAVQVEQEIAAAQTVEKPQYCFPPIDLLERPSGRASDGTAEMRENTRRLNESLASFKIEAHITNVTRGPSVTRYEVELEKGVRLNKLTTAADDIALSLGASGVRIAPVPGKISVVGIEVPNLDVTKVQLREVIDSAAFNKSRSSSSIAVGKDIGGSCIVGNIAKFPHILIAGTTGSGKSVCINSIIISLLYKSGPEDVKLIMVDPKMVELGIYNGIPHLLIPVVTDPKKAAGSLQWAVTEMMRRYRSMSDAGVRDLESYNSMIDGGELEGERLPQIVVIIDELADLMLVAAKEVEESICRIAQMGRAAGIHLIIATQRPSADVITGLMKANIPSRIAFSVASAMESRIILDTQGAEKLVGKGDMLYAPIGSGKPQRVQGCFVTDAEVEAVANYVKEHYASTYDQTVMDDIERKAEQTGSKSAPPTASDPDPSADELAGDEMLPAAVEVILETKQASVSMLQRRLKLGYARAARIVDEMEEKGIVGPFMGSKPRQILITKEQWEQMKGGQTLVVEPPFEVADEPVPEELF